MSKKLVLIIEDDAYLREYLKEFFTGELELDVETASSTNEALRMLDRGNFDLVFSDNQFPRFSDSRSRPEPDQGLEVMQWMWADEKYGDTPFILHTSEASKHVVEQVERHKRILLIKPHPFSDIGAVVEQALKRETT